jgi:arylsulfatase A-like enzyme
MEKTLSRRQFLKLSALLPLGSLLPQGALMPKGVLPPERQATNPNEANIVIFVFDALSAMHLPLYGYARGTAPNLARFAERATVYHNHYSGGNFTIPGTASLLTGTYPWTHRGLSANHKLLDEFKRQNIFSQFDEHYRLVYSHNRLPYRLFKQFRNSIDLIKDRGDLYLGTDLFAEQLFPNDDDIASIGMMRAIRKAEDGLSYSLILNAFYELLQKAQIKFYVELFPRGIPTSEDSFYILDHAVDWTLTELDNSPQPFLGYFHYYPPHDPYLTKYNYIDAFHDDGYKPVKKPEHPLSHGRAQKTLTEDLRWYDEFILYADEAFGRLLEGLEKSGLRENTWVIFTSDHGEMFERGFFRHFNESLHQPIVRVPLLISRPGQEERYDVTTTSSGVDLLPTLLQGSGRAIPKWIEGRPLPPYGDRPLDDERPVFALEAKHAQQHGVIDPSTGMIVRAPYKLLYYHGYPKLEGVGDLVELYNLEEDPQELNDLSAAKPQITASLLGELQERYE